MRLGTWNLARPLPSSTRRAALLAAEIARVEADVWVLTETHDAVTPGAAFRSVSTTGTDRPGDPGERWVTIWSRFPVEPLAPTSDPIRAVAARIVLPHGVPLVVYGNVLPWLGSGWRDLPSGGGRAFAGALEAQVSDWLTLRALFPDHDLVVAGDFNQDLSEVHYYGSRTNRRLLRHGLERAGLVALTGDAHDPVRRGSPACACIDHVCLSNPARWQIKELQRWPDAPGPNRRLSDHFGIVVEFFAGS